MTKRRLLGSGLLGVVIALAAACGQGGGIVQPPPPPAVVTVYRPGETGDLLYPEKYTLAERDPATPSAAVNTLIGARPREGGHINIFPENLRLLGLKIEDGRAEVNFSKELLENSSGGSLHEMLLVASIVNTLTEFPEITSVQIIVEGQKIDTIGGHIDLLDPLRRNESLIQKT
jgi:spore germination protein GerM